MAQQRIDVPNIGDSRDVDVVEVLVKVGDRVEPEQTLVVLESEKASMDVPSTGAGVVKELLIRPGDKASEGTPILVLETDVAAAEKGAPPPKASQAAEAPPKAAAQPKAAEPVAATQTPEPATSGGSASQQVAVPNIGDSRDVDVVEVLVKVGDRVSRDQTLIVLESEKASMDVPAPSAGVVKQLLIKAGDKASEGTPILILEVEAGQAATAKRPSPGPAASDAGKPAAAVPAPTSEPASTSGASRTVPPPPPAPTEPTAPPAAAQSKAPLPYASPAVRRLARELGVDLQRVQGTARKGRITKEDVQGYVKEALRGGATSGGFAPPLEAPEIDFSQFGPISVQPLTKIQRLTGRNLHRSWSTVPHVTQFDEADITELEEFRKQIRDKQPDLKLTLVTFFLKALVHGLKRMPRFNASLDRTGENLVLKQYFHIGVAVDTPNGLVVPVIRDVDRKGLADLAQELTSVSERARARKLTPSDMQGASISISSLGGIGGTAFTPIINPPEVAILGVSRARFAPVYQNGAFVPRLMCPLSLSYDHRVIDGADGARFTQLLCEVLGDVRQLLL